MAKSPPEMQIDTDKLYDVTISTGKGDIVMELDPQLAPKTVNNFVSLARSGYYDGLTFHRVVSDFVVQGGDPDGTGRGGPGYQFEDEPVKGDYIEGAIAMANAGPNTNGSQFFICTVDDRFKLEKKYNLFGYVMKGMSVAKDIKVGDKMDKVEVVEKDRA
ncbi:MAG TPA: peptidylprolyl isomerase [Chloroflexota bacterium]|jgi:cyclophilin family peptidyl-prolyl cis-trans isomerase|nr:peptidylprolyl isomerase [Chloroflexota bacterium]